MALQIEYNEEEKKRLLAKRSEKANKAAERNAAASDAYKKALDTVEYDEDRLVVFTMPERFGGAVIHRLPAPEAWTAVSKQVTKALLSDGKKADTAATIAALVENSKLLVHPPLSELQEWRELLPDLYSEIHNVMDARCSHGQSAGK